MGLLRSEDMMPGKLVLPSSEQEAKKFILAIGKPNKDGELHVQFEDMKKNTDHGKRPFAKYVQRVEKMQQNIDYLTKTIAETLEPEEMDAQFKTNEIDGFMKRGDEEIELKQLELLLQEKFKTLEEFKTNNGKLLEELEKAREEKAVLEIAQRWLTSTSNGAGLEAPLLDQQQRRLQVVAGVVTAEARERFRRALWRQTRGNIFVEFGEDFGTTSKSDEKAETLSNMCNVCVIYFQNSPDIATGQGALMQKVVKVCDSFSVRRYSWPDSAEEAMQRKKECEQRVNKQNETIEGKKSFVRSEVQELLQTSGPERNSQIEDWRLFCKETKSAYVTMNMCDVSNMTMVVDVWYPSEEHEQFVDVLKTVGKGRQDQQAFLQRSEKKGGEPTYIKVNGLTEFWQRVVNEYGCPEYKTANPALLTTVTFPFVFGMMYGDIGHGTLLFLAGLYMCCGGVQEFRHSLPVIHQARLPILQMGLFAIFAGFMYNDFFGMASFDFFGSRFSAQPDDQGWMQPLDSFNKNNDPNFNSDNGGSMLPFDKFRDGPYPFGVDPAWHGSQNELLFVNSLKMKLSVLIGVSQMLLGVGLRFANTLYHRNVTDFLFECLPMLVFMLAFFGYMDYMIIYKWTHVIPYEDDGVLKGPPSIINSLICMAMQTPNAQPLWNDPNWGTSDSNASTLMLFTVLSVPLLLFPKPIIEWIKQKNSKNKVEEEGLEGDHEEHHDISEIFIHQIIETIEFVLGTVSHTASYLRIWALSLAHQQLSLVFFSKTLQNMMGGGGNPLVNGLAIYALFAMWFSVTFAVLLIMDVLECFLHTLRLHWVEFQSKFFKSEKGILFTPYNVQAVILAE